MRRQCQFTVKRSEVPPKCAVRSVATTTAASSSAAAAAAAAAAVAAVIAATAAAGYHSAASATASTYSFHAGMCFFVQNKKQTNQDREG